MQMSTHAENVLGVCIVRVVVVVAVVVVVVVVAVVVVRLFSSTTTHIRWFRRRAHFLLPVLVLLRFNLEFASVRNCSTAALSQQVRFIAGDVNLRRRCNVIRFHARRRRVMRGVLNLVVRVKRTR